MHSKKEWESENKQVILILYYLLQRTQITFKYIVFRRCFWKKTCDITYVCA